MTDRERFEAWVRDKPWAESWATNKAMLHFKDGTYAADSVRAAWEAWQAAYALAHEAARADALIIWHMYSCPFSTCAICRKIADDHHRRLRLSYGHDHTQKLEAAIARSEARE